MEKKKSRPGSFNTSSACWPDSTVGIQLLVEALPSEPTGPGGEGQATRGQGPPLVSVPSEAGGKAELVWRTARDPPPREKPPREGTSFCGLFLFVAEADVRFKATLHLGVAAQRQGTLAAHSGLQPAQGQPTGEAHLLGDHGAPFRVCLAGCAFSGGTSETRTVAS